MRASAQALTEVLREREMQSLHLERAMGAEIAAALGLPAIAEASDDLVRWWGHGVTLIRELVSDDPALLARWG